jgi:hypothetical protein
MAQAVSRRPLTAVARVCSQVNPVGFVVDKVATWAGFSSHSSVFPCQYHSTVGSTFAKIKKNSSFIHSFIHPFTHPHPGTDKRPVKAAVVQWDVSLTPITRIPEMDCAPSCSNNLLIFLLRYYFPRCFVILFRLPYYVEYLWDCDSHFSRPSASFSWIASILFRWEFQLYSSQNSTYRDQWWALVNLQIPLKARNFLTNDY